MLIHSYTDIIKKIPKEIVTYHNYDLLISKYKILQKDYKQTFQMIYAFEQLLKGRFPKHKKDTEVLSISFKSISKIIGDRKARNKEHIFFDIFQEDISHIFFRDKLKVKTTEGHTKGYIISEELLDDLIYLKIKKVKNPITYYLSKFEEKICYNVSTENGRSVYLTRKDLKEELNLTNKETKEFMDKYMEVFNTVPSKQHRKILFNKTLDKKVPDYAHEPSYNLERFNELIQILYANKNKGISKLDILELMQLKDCLQDNKNNYLDLVYQRKGGGRLYQRVNYDSNITAQLIKSNYRDFLFEGQYMYDIDTSVINIFLQLHMKLIEVKSFPSIERYIENKEYFRKEVMKQGLTYKQAKQYFTALLFGANLKTNLEYLEKYSDIVKDIGANNLKRVLENKNVEKLVQEIIDLYSALGTYYKNKSLIPRKLKTSNIRYNVVNTRGDTLRIEKWNNSKVLSFIYNGVESQVLDICIKIAKPSLLLFDGFITTENIDVEMLQGVVLKELGYALTFSKELLKGSFEEISS